MIDNIDEQQWAVVAPSDEVSSIDDIPPETLEELSDNEGGDSGLE